MSAIFKGLPVRVRNALEGARIETLEDLASRTLLDLQRTKNVGRVTIATLRRFLAEHGLALKGDPLPPITISELRDALVEARNGLGWYRAEFPGADGRGDDEVLARIDSVIARAEVA